DPRDADTVYVAVASNGVNGLAGNTGIWKSSDGGASWTNTTGGISTTDAFTDLVMDPSNPATLYAAVGTPGGSVANGVYKSTDGGATWARAGDSPGRRRVGRIRLAIAATTPDTLYASMVGTGRRHSSGGGTLFRMMKTSDGGHTWQTLPGTPNYLGTQGDYAA